MLINQKKVSETGGGSAIVTYNELGLSLDALNRAKNEAEVLRHVFSKGNIWRGFFINPNTGALSAAPDGRNFPLIQIPIEYNGQSVEELKVMMQNTEGRSVPNLNNPAAVKGSSFVCAKEDTSITHITILWGLAHGSLGASMHCRSKIMACAKKQFNPMLAFLQGQIEPNLMADPMNPPLLRWFNVVGKNTDPNELLDEPTMDDAIQQPTATEAAVFVNSEILPQLPPKAITSHITTSPKITESGPIRHIIAESYPGKEVVIILLVLFLVITALSNIFAWANIIEIATMMTKIIVSGVGSVIGVACLIAAIDSGCKDKVCEKCFKCRYSRAHNSDYMIPVEDKAVRSKRDDI
jgi:hypothetical protein